jgi:parallel beta-helix repeat protein
MSNKTSITNLPKVQGMNPTDLLLVQNATSTSTILFKDFVIGPDNVSFYNTVSGMQQQINEQGTSAGISVTNTYSTLRTINPGSTGNKRVVYVREREDSKGSETGGFFMFDTGSNITDNDGTVLKPTSVTGSGRWVRINYEFINPIWFGAEASISVDQTTPLQAAIDYAFTVKKPVKIPAGIFLTKGIWLQQPNIQVIGAPGAILKYQNEVASPPSGVRNVITVGTSTSDSANYAIIENIQIDMSNYNPSSDAKANGIHIQSSSYCHISNCIIHGGQDDINQGFVITDGRFNRITNCIASGTMMVGASVADWLYTNASNDANYNMVSNNIIKSTTRGLLESSPGGSDEQDWNAFTNNIVDSTSTAVNVTGTNTISGLNVKDDIK